MPGDQLPSYHPNLRVERDGDVVTVTLDRPESRNGCTGEMWAALGATFRDLSWSGARAIVLTGAGGNFCTGADLTPAPGGLTRRLDSTLLPHNVHGMRVLGDAVLAIHGCPVPVIAKVEGLCVGAGVGVALAADLTWCADTARFSLIFAKRGISLDFGTSWLLRQRIGVHKAKELAFTARMLSGTEAAEIGFVNAAVPVADLDAAVRDVVDTIVAGPPLALSITKRELDNASLSSLAHALEVEGLAQSVHVHTNDLREALTAFVEKRPPTFEGR